MNRNLDLALIELDEHLTLIIKTIFESYNLLVATGVDETNRHDLHRLKSVLELLRNFHCPVLHNENRSNVNDSRRSAWIELHHSLFMAVRDHINDLQDGKKEYDFEPIQDKLKNLMELADIFVDKVLKIDLRQAYCIRVQFYKHHWKAMGMHCAKFHTPTWLKIASRTVDTELKFAQLCQRTHDLLHSFRDTPHYLHFEREPAVHTDFTLI